MKKDNISIFLDKFVAKILSARKINGVVYTTEIDTAKRYGRRKIKKLIKKDRI